MYIKGAVIYLNTANFNAVLNNCTYLNNRGVNGGVIYTELISNKNLQIIGGIFKDNFAIVIFNYILKEIG